MIPPDDPRAVNKDQHSGGIHAHPRPQLRRERWTSLNGPWDFAIDREQAWADPKAIPWSAKIQVPFSPETPASGIGEAGYYSVVWYR
ncbi:MAG: hypothetical protein JOZ62_00310, partial [Acidobacteriaceae bacterium]|nr:hypothetical protein [Acidobacteriaceae bacterium]